MRTVRDEDGTHYLLLKESAESSLVRDPQSGQQHHIPNEQLEHVDGASPLDTAAAALPSDVRRVLTAVPDERALGLLVELDRRGPTDVRTLLSAYDLCESDMHGLLAEFRAAGLVTETRVAGQRGYETTDRTSDALVILQE